MKLKVLSMIGILFFSFASWAQEAGRTIIASEQLKDSPLYDGDVVYWDDQWDQSKKNEKLLLYKDTIFEFLAHTGDKEISPETCAQPDELESVQYYYCQQAGLFGFVGMLDHEQHDGELIDVLAFLVGIVAFDRAWVLNYRDGLKMALANANFNSIFSPKDKMIVKDPVLLDQAWDKHLEKFYKPLSNVDGTGAPIIKYKGLLGQMSVKPSSSHLLTNFFEAVLEEIDLKYVDKTWKISNVPLTGKQLSAVFYDLSLLDKSSYKAYGQLLQTNFKSSPDHFHSFIKEANHPEKLKLIAKNSNKGLPNHQAFKKVFNVKKLAAKRIATASAIVAVVAGIYYLADYLAERRFEDVYNTGQIEDFEDPAVLSQQLDQNPHYAALFVMHLDEIHDAVYTLR